MASCVTVDVIEQVSLSAQLHNQEGLVWPNVGPQELDDIGVVAGPEQVNLPFEAHLLLQSGPLNDFDGHHGRLQEHANVHRAAAAWRVSAKNVKGAVGTSIAKLFIGKG